MWIVNYCIENGTFINDMNKLYVYPYVDFLIEHIGATHEKIWIGFNFEDGKA